MQKKLETPVQPAPPIRHDPPALEPGQGYNANISSDLYLPLRWAVMLETLP